MKEYTRIFVGLILIGLFSLTTGVFGQSSNQDKMVITETITTKDGQVIVKKKAVSDPTEISRLMETYKAMQKEQGTDKEISSRSIQITSGDDKDLYFMFNENEDNNRWHQMHERTERQKVKRTKSLLGIYPGGSDNGEGVRVSSVVKGKGAEAAGLISGDVIYSIEGVETNSVSTLREVLDRYKPGQAVSVTFNQGGNIKTEKVILSAQEYFTYYEERDPCKVFIGVYSTSSKVMKGVKINDVIPNTSADEYGLQKGDVIISLDGVPVYDHNSLVAERDKHQPGEWYNLKVFRAEKTFDLKAKFKDCENEEIEEEIIEDPKEDVIDPTDDPALIENQGLVFEEFKAFPNPTVNNVTINYQGEAVPTLVRITDVSGKVIFEENLPNFDGYYQKQVSLIKASPGTLTLSVVQDGKIASQGILLLDRA
ncbi:MAG: PDZ domain-containing protein [Saprospiraceae bacterium]